MKNYIKVAFSHDDINSFFEPKIMLEAKDGESLSAKELKDFLKENEHEDWSLYIYDTLSEDMTRINCKYKDIIDVISYVYNVEHAEPISFISSDEELKAYVVGMPLTRGRLDLRNLNVNDIL